MILDLFAGPGGWSEGLRHLGLADLGIEWDGAACATRAAAGHLTIRADVAAYPPEPFAGKVTGLIASPPCQDFSTAGKKAGRAGSRGQLIDTVPEWVDALRPSWVACEQVPPALRVWQEFADLFGSWGYSTWAGVLNAADYGVPQTRRRAILLASINGPAAPPEPTHAKNPGQGLFGATAPWVTMAQALGWGPSTVNTGRDWKKGGTRADAQVIDAETQPSPTLTGITGGQWLINRNDQSGSEDIDKDWPLTRPATTLAGRDLVGDPGANANRFNNATKSRNDGIKITAAEALTLQTFRADYPVQGTKTKQFEQIGNAVPPLLAAHIVAALTGRSLAAAA